MSVRPIRRAIPLVGLEKCDYPYTLQQVADELGLSRERVRQIQTVALKKVQAEFERRGYTLDDLT